MGFCGALRWVREVGCKPCSLVLKSVNVKQCILLFLYVSYGHYSLGCPFLLLGHHFSIYLWAWSKFTKSPAFFSCTSHEYCYLPCTLQSLISNCPGNDLPLHSPGLVASCLSLMCALCFLGLSDQHSVLVAAMPGLSQLCSLYWEGIAGWDSISHGCSRLGAFLFFPVHTHLSVDTSCIAKWQLINTWVHFFHTISYIAYIISNKYFIGISFIQYLKS